MGSCYSDDHVAGDHIHMDINLIYIAIQYHKENKKLPSEEMANPPTKGSISLSDLSK